jgi:hypothetical protein
MRHRWKPARPPKQNLLKPAARAARLPLENHASPVPGKAQRLRKIQYPLRGESRIHRTKRFVFEPTSFPNADVDLHCLATRNPIGWKQKDSCFPKRTTAEIGASDCASQLINEMKNVLVDLAQALRERLAIIHDEQSRLDEARHTARLRAVSEKIDKLQATLPQPVDPRLAHYLQRKSYDKALAHLEGRDD